jgi:hypothetical protein
LTGRNLLSLNVKGMPNVPDYSSYVGVKKIVVSQTGDSAIVARKGRAVSGYTNYFPLYRGVGFVGNSLISNKFVNFPACPLPPERFTYTYGSIQGGAGSGTYIYSLAVSSDGGVSFVGSNFGVYVNRNSGVSGFTLISDGTSNFPPQVAYGAVGISGDGNIMVAGASTNLWISRDRGFTWTTVSFPVAGTTAISRNGKVIIYNATTALYISRDSGVTFTTHTSANLGVSNAGKAIACSCDGQVIYAGASGSYLTVSVDSGYTWKAYDGTGGKRAIGDGTLNFNHISCNDDGTRAVTSTSNQVCYVITNYGNSWNTVPLANQPWGNTGMSAGGRYMCVSYDNGVNFSGIYISQDYGASWNSITINGCITAGRFTSDGKRLYCLGGHGGAATQRWYQAA